MRHFLIIATVLLINVSTFAQNPFWTHADKQLITAIVKLDKNNPNEVAQYFKDRGIQKCDTIKEGLGFGWSMWAPGIGGGYISVSATFYYYHDSIASYSLTPRLPEEKGLQERYKKWYNDFFAYANGEIQPFKFNEAVILSPLSGYKGTLKNIPDSIADYMSPNSGTMYGYAGGMGMLLQNRKAFIKIKDSLSNDQLELLMYSINPASRLTAIEYYWKRKGFLNNQETIDNWIEQNFKEMPTVKSMSGCFSVIEDTRSFVSMHAIMRYK